MQKAANKNRKADMEIENVVCDHRYKMQIKTGHV